MTKKNKFISVLTAATLLCTGIGTAGVTTSLRADAAESIESSMDWDTLNIAGGGFVSGIITGDDQMYARTDVGGAYRYDYEAEKMGTAAGISERCRQRLSERRCNVR